MSVVRSLIFNGLFFGWTILLSVTATPVLAGRRTWAQVAARIWTAGIMALAAGILGLRYRVIGAENLPPGPVVVAAKHQSAWDTLIFHVVTRDPAYVLKQELFRLPFVGWLMWKSGMIGIDRAKGLQAMKHMLRGAEQAVADGRQIVIFPEGTRTAPGSRQPYHPGVAMLYQHLSVPVVPVALNSGRFWGRRSFLKRPGVITLEFLSPIPAGLSRRAFMAELESRIESAVDRLDIAANTDSPHPTPAAVPPPA